MMPRVHFVKKARKDNPVAKKGESYYWWKFRYGGKRYSRTRPRASQLTQSPYYGAVRALVEQIEDSNPEDFDEFESLKEEVRDELENLRDEAQSSLDNMPEQLQYAPTGELLQERIDALENAESELDNIDDFDFDEIEFDENDYPRDEWTKDEIEEAREVHEEDERRRYRQEFEDWAGDAMGQLAELVADTEV